MADTTNENRAVVLPRSCSALVAGGKTITEGEALRLKGVGRKTLIEMIRRGFITGRSEEDQLRRAKEQEQAKLRREEEWKTAASRRMKARRIKVEQMIADTEERLKKLRAELERLNAPDQATASVKH